MTNWYLASSLLHPIKSMNGICWAATVDGIVVWIFHVHFHYNATLLSFDLRRSYYKWKDTSMVQTESTDET